MILSAQRTLHVVCLIVLGVFLVHEPMRVDPLLVQFIVLLLLLDVLINLEVPHLHVVSIVSVDAVDLQHLSVALNVLQLEVLTRKVLDARVIGELRVVNDALHPAVNALLEQAIFLLVFDVER